MRFLAAKKRAGQFDLEAFWGTMGLLALVAARFLPLQKIGSFCVLKNMAGLPCPSCGGTRSFMLMAHGHVAQSFWMNPMAAVLFVGLLAYVPYAMVAVIGQTPRIRMRLEGNFERCASAGAFCLAVMANWAYLIMVGR